MEGRYEAHYSKHSAWMLLAMAVIIPAALLLSVVFWPDTASFTWVRILLAVILAAD